MIFPSTSDPLRTHRSPDSPRPVQEFHIVELRGVWNKANARGFRDHLKSLLDFMRPLSYQEETFTERRLVWSSRQDVHNLPSDGSMT